MKIPFLLILILFCSCDSKMSSVDKILHEEIVKGKSPSVTYIFFNNASVVYNYTGGYADVKAHKKITAATTFNGLSVTKTFTALAVLQLEEKGLLQLNDPVKKYLPHFPYGSNITIRHLLTHTSGLPNPIPLKWTHLISEHDTFDRNSFFTSVFDKNSKVKSIPGDKCRYSNLGYVVLGQVIEQVSGSEYEEYITTNILSKVSQPGELSFDIDPAIHAKGYQRKNSFMNFILGFLIDKQKFMGPAEGELKPFRYYCINGPAYGGLIITSGGMVKFGQAILNRSLLTKESTGKYIAENRTNNGKATGICLSWHTGVLNGRRYVHHAGGGGGYYIEFRLYPGLNCGSVLIFNRTGMKDERFLDKVDRQLLDTFTQGDAD